MSDAPDARAMIAAVPMLAETFPGGHLPLAILPCLSSRFSTVTPYWGERP